MILLIVLLCSMILMLIIYTIVALHYKNKLDEKNSERQQIAVRGSVRGHLDLTETPDNLEIRRNLINSLRSKF